MKSLPISTIRFRQVLASNALWAGLLALAMALAGENFLLAGARPDGNTALGTSVAWLVLAGAVLLLGWQGTFVDRSLLTSATVARFLKTDILRAVALLAAIGLNLLALRTLHANWNSLAGGLLWVASLAVLLVACVQQPPLEVAAEPEEPGRWHLPLALETGILVAIMAVTLAIRLYRLGDLTPGMHGDEGEAGVDALSILHGHPVSPFARGWFNQPNMYYWSLALMMRIFGTGLAGLRAFAVLCGLLTVLFLYLLAREMFGQRAAILAGALLSFQSADLIFSRQEFSNDTLPAFLAAAFYFLVRGLRTRNYLSFALSGLVAGFSLYYFAGGRLVGPAVLLLLLYLLLVHRTALRSYWRQAPFFLVGLGVVSTPFLLYNQTYPIPSAVYPNNRFIWLNQATLSLQYHTSSWPVIIWNQLLHTLSIVFYGADASAMSALDFPIARPIEVALLVLGLLWAAWRWRDTRCALISIWFWTSIIGGGVLTVGAPNLPRIIGMLPAMALAMAMIVDHFAGQLALEARVWRLAQEPKRWLGAGAVGGVIVVAGVQNWQMYGIHYLNERNNAATSAQAAFVQRLGPGYRYYDLGAPVLYWGHGDNRFINPHADGVDVINPSASLPIVDSGHRGAAFLIWPWLNDYLAALQAYYPEGHLQRVPLNDPANPLTTYVLTRAQIQHRRAVHARYVPIHGKPVERMETRLGHNTPPPGLTYPVRAAWNGDIFIPRYGIYQLRLLAPAGTKLLIDGRQMVAMRKAATQVVTVRLALGLHTVDLQARLASAGTPLDLRWARSGAHFHHIPRRFLWDGAGGREWVGTFRTQNPARPLRMRGAVLQRRVDGFLGFRSTQDLLDGIPFAARWTTTLHVTKAGQYQFELSSEGNSTLKVDRLSIITNVYAGTDPHDMVGDVYLSPGVHSVVVNYEWHAGLGSLELWWIPPGGQRSLFVSPAVTPGHAAAWVEKVRTIAEGIPSAVHSVSSRLPAPPATVSRPTFPHHKGTVHVVHLP